MYVCQGLRIFTNGIIWWGQKRFRGDQYAGDVIMVCKHLRSIFRWHCLEMLPHWVWSGEDENDAPPAEPIPSTEEEWEAEVSIGRFSKGGIGDADKVVSFGAIPIEMISNDYHSGLFVPWSLEVIPCWCFVINKGR